MDGALSTFEVEFANQPVSIINEVSKRPFEPREKVTSVRVNSLPLQPVDEFALPLDAVFGLRNMPYRLPKNGATSAKPPKPLNFTLQVAQSKGLL